MLAAVEIGMVVVGVAAAEACRRCTAGVREEVAGLMVVLLVRHMVVVGPVLVGHKVRIVVVRGVVGWLLRSLSTDLLESRRRTWCMLNVVDGQKRTRTMLCQVPRDLRRCFGVGGLFGAALRTGQVEESLFELVLASSLMGCEG
jgi:hypothetical protein